VIEDRPGDEMRNKTDEQQIVPKPVAVPFAAPTIDEKSDLRKRRNEMPIDNTMRGRPACQPVASAMLSKTKFVYSK
jgi:hypothetical protein